MTGLPARLKTGNRQYTTMGSLAPPLYSPPLGSRLFLVCHACLKATGVFVRQRGGVDRKGQIGSVGTEGSGRTAGRAWERSR
jgi:hypothetical protein